MYNTFGAQPIVHQGPETVEQAYIFPEILFYLKTWRGDCI